MENPESFWKFVSKERFPLLKDAAMKLYSMFGSTYICECTFSAMNNIKTKNRNQLGNEALQACLRMATTTIPVDTNAIVEEEPRPQMSH